MNQKEQEETNAKKVAAHRADTEKQLSMRAKQHAEAMLLEMGRFSSLVSGEARTIFFDTLSDGIKLVRSETPEARGERQAKEVVGQLAQRMRTMADKEKHAFVRTIGESL